MIQRNVIRLSSLQNPCIFKHRLNPFKISSLIPFDFVMDRKIKRRNLRGDLN